VGEVVTDPNIIDLDHVNMRELGEDLRLVAQVDPRPLRPPLLVNRHLDRDLPGEVEVDRPIDRRVAAQRDAADQHIATRSHARERVVDVEAGERLTQQRRRALRQVPGRRRAPRLEPIGAHDRARRDAISGHNRLPARPRTLEFLAHRPRVRRCPRTV
jgi:hypothetical protein